MAAAAGGPATAGALPQQHTDEVLRPGSRFGPEDDVHELGEELGSGAAARVYTCVRQKTGEQLAAKVINLQRLCLLGDFDNQMQKLNREVQILSELHHPRIVNLHFVHRTKHWIFLVMELVRGGELFDQIVRNRTLQEVEAKYIFCQLLEGLGYMHSKHVIHRDLKPENILIQSSRDVPAPLSGKLHDVKIADFGLSKVINEGTSMAKTFVGTPQYWAPEVLNVHEGGSYTQAVDFWSLGAVLFVMLCGRYPFDGKKMPLEDQIRTAAFSMNTAVWQKVSDAAKDVVRGLLKVNPSERLALEDCLRHPWLADGRSPVPWSPPGPLVTEVSSGNANGAVPMVTQPSNISDFSGRSEGSARIEQTLSQEQDRVQERVDSEGSPKEQKGKQGNQVPSIKVGDSRPAGSGGDSTAQGTIFCLNELLKLQVSIAGSLEMACLAFRHADTELSDAIRKTFWQARDLFTAAANVVSQYAEVAQQVGQLVLADLKLAVDEKEPSLAVSLLGMVKGWVANMKKDGENIHQQYRVLQESVHGLIRRAQHAKTDADRRLAEAVQVAEAELSAPPPSPRTQQHYLSIEPGEGGKQENYRGGVETSNQSTDSNPRILGIGRNTPDSAAAREGTLNLPFSMNMWTKQLFEQLSQAQEGSTKDIKADSITQKSAPAADDETWKRDVLELLFMAPGINTAQLPKFEQFNFSTEVRNNAEEGHAAEEVTTPTMKGTKRPSQDVPMGGHGGQPASGIGSGAGVASHTSNLDEKIVRFNPTANEKATADVVTHSSASLLRALRELKRVDEILHGCSAFWANMDGTVQKLAQMKEHTETLVNFAANSKALKQRFEQRLEEYTNFWVSLERVCRQYCLDHQAAFKRMYEVIREVADAADVIDTTQSARMGMVLAMQDRQRRHGGDMQF